MYNACPTFIKFSKKNYMPISNILKGMCSEKNIYPKSYKNSNILNVTKKVFVNFMSFNET
jgi:hypothetical protein